MSLTTPREYQRVGVKALHTKFDGRGLLADDMGLGKSFQALLYAWKYLPEDPPGPIVVVCPSHLKINWKREAAQHLGMRAIVLSHQKVPDHQLPPTNPNQLYVINYDILVPPRKDGKGRQFDRSWVKFLSDLHPRLIIGDEIQYIKNRRAARSKAFERLCEEVEHLLFLSGSPLTNKPQDLWFPLHLLRPDIYDSFFSFASEYTHTFRAFGRWNHKGARNLDQLHAELRRTCMVRRLKSEVLSELPQITVSVIPVEVDLTEYHRAENDYLAFIAETSPDRLAGATAAQELTQLNFLKEFAGRLKVDAITHWVEDFFDGTDAKLLMGAIHYKVTEPLLARFRSQAVLVDGRMTPEKKQAAFDRFNLNPATRLCIGNMQAAGTGWNCTATSDELVVELPWVPTDLTQFINRIHGLERGLPGVSAHIRIMVAAGTIEEDLCRVIQVKQNWADQALDGKAKDDATLDVYEQVKRLMKDRVESRTRKKVLS